VASTYLRPFLRLLAVPLVLVSAGTLGYRLIEGWPLFDALYMTVTTMTTVGFMEVHPLSPAGRVFTIGLIMSGVFTLFYAAGEVIRSIVSGEVRRAMGRQRMQKSLEELQGHLVVCGFGRMGRLVCEQFSSIGMPFVVVERDPELLRGFDIPHGIPLEGDATLDEVLKRAGIERARGLVTVAASDADNLYMVMSARFLNDKLFIVARADEEGAERKLLRAGASRVVSPYSIGGQRVALAVLRPTVMDFIELATRKEHLELQLEETEIQTGSRLAGQALKDSQVRQELGAIIVAIKKPDGRMLFNPDAETLIEPRDILITMGHRHQLDRLESMARA
jgi:voltage-gated potassium channel